MFISTDQGAGAPPLSPAQNATNNHHPEIVRHMVFGSLIAVQADIHTLHKRGYAEPNDWSQPISTGRANEVMAILTRRINL